MKKVCVLNVTGRILITACCFLLTLNSFSCKKNDYSKNKTLDTTEAVKLHIAGKTPSFKAMENVITAFCKMYPNVTIDYEYLQNYEKSLETRLVGNDDIDLFVTKNIQEDSSLLPYVLELKSNSEHLNLSSTYEGLIRNFTITNNNLNELYAVPLCGELRGMYVNKTILSKYNLSVPKNYVEFMNCCKVLKNAGYIPLQGNPGNFSQLLMYPYICNIIANSDDYKTTYDKVNFCKPGVSLLFKEPLSRLYDIVSLGFYNYKFVENTYHLFTDADIDTITNDFFNIKTNSDGKSWKKDDVGQVPFLPGTMSWENSFEKAKQDYHSKIEYEFILAPVGNDSGFAYLSPSEGLAINKRSAHIEWALEFMNYLFSEKVNKKFASDQNLIPNTHDAMDYINNTFKVNPNCISQLGQVSFDYVFYSVMQKTLIAISKGNNPKYMQTDGQMYSLDYYMDALEKDFATERR